MSTQSHTMPESLPVQSIASAEIPSARLLYWSVRRELWENRSIYIAPLAAAAIALLAFMGSSIVGIWESRLRLDPTRSYEALVAPHDLLAGLMMLTGIVINVFYCLDALHGERRDRSILFWKSLPVSDRITVLSKACIPFLIVPLLSFVITFATQLLMLLFSSVVLLGTGQSVALLWAKISFGRMSLLVLYHFFTAHAIWPAPVFCWFLLVSGWPRRATVLWAVLPVVVIGGVEGIIFHSYRFVRLVGLRLIGDAPAMVTTGNAFPTGPMTHITPGVFLSSPGLWIGLVISAVFLAAAIRLRRQQGPI